MKGKERKGKRKEKEDWGRVKEERNDIEQKYVTLCKKNKKQQQQKKKQNKKQTNKKNKHLSVCKTSQKYTQKCNYKRTMNTIAKPPGIK